MLLLLLLPTLAAAAAPDQAVTVAGVAGRVVTFFITPQYFNWTEGGAGGGAGSPGAGAVRYLPLQAAQPALPPWLQYHYSPQYRAGLLYGVPPRPGTTSLRVVATNRETFDTATIAVNINVARDREERSFHVRLKIDNLNIEDVFDKRRSDRLLNLFRSRFWEAASDLQLTFADSALNQGGRRPLQPSAKDGVVLQLGSSHNFSAALRALDAETAPLRRHESCSYKRVSVERHFRGAGLAVDWCSFRLVTAPPAAPPRPGGGAGAGRVHGDTSSWTAPRRSAVARQSRVAELLAALSLPLLVFTAFSVCLGLLLWTDCGSEKDNSNIFIDSLFDIFYDCFGGGAGVAGQQRQLLIRNNNNTVEAARVPSCSPAASQRDLRASSVQRQTETLRSLARARGREVSPRPRLGGAATPLASLDGSSVASRSRTSSPSPSACGKSSASRPRPRCLTSVLCPGSPGGRQSRAWEMFDTLNRPNPPAYNSLPRGGGGAGGGAGDS